MNILVFAHDSTLYGASQSLLTALEGIALNDHRKILVLLPYKGELEQELSSRNINFKVVGFPRCVEFRKQQSVYRRFKSFVRYFRAEKKILPDLIRITEEFQPDIVYTNTSVVSLGYKIAKRFKVPHIWHVREFGNADYDFRYFPSRADVKRKIARSAHVIFGSKSLKMAWLGERSNHVSVIYNGIVDQREHYTRKEIGSTVFTIGVVGGIVEGKGQDVAISALSLLPQKARLFIYGEVVDAGYRKKLAELISSLKLTERVTFMGFDRNKDNVYGAIDILLSCSKKEAFGRTIVEAMQRGVPVIANNAGGVVEIIDNGIDGLLYNQSPEELSANVLRLLNENGLYEKISSQGIRKASTFSIASYVAAIDLVFKNTSGKP